LEPVLRATQGHT